MMLDSSPTQPPAHSLQWGIAWPLTAWTLPQASAATLSALFSVSPQTLPQLFFTIPDWWQQVGGSEAHAFLLQQLAQEIKVNLDQFGLGVWVTVELIHIHHFEEAIQQEVMDFCNPNVGGALLPRFAGFLKDGAEGSCIV